jgi:hypothetical protein
MVRFGGEENFGFINFLQYFYKTIHKNQDGVCEKFNKMYNTNFSPLWILLMEDMQKYCDITENDKVNDELFFNFFSNFCLNSTTSVI